MLRRLAHLQDAGYVVTSQSADPHVPYWWQAGGSLIPPGGPPPLTIQVVTPAAAPVAAPAAAAAPSGVTGYLTQLETGLLPFVPASFWTFTSSHPFVAVGTLAAGVWLVHHVFFGAARRRVT